jgi:hypothetical protein
VTTGREPDVDWAAVEGGRRKEEGVVVRKYSCRMQKRVGGSRDDFSTVLQQQTAGRWFAEKKRESLDGWLALLADPGAKNATKHAYRVWRRVGMGVMGGDGWAAPASR